MGRQKETASMPRREAHCYATRVAQCRGAVFCCPNVAEPNKFEVKPFAVHVAVWQWHSGVVPGSLSHLHKCSGLDWATNEET